MAIVAPVAPHPAQRLGERSGPLQSRAPAELLEVELDRTDGALWLNLAATAPAYVTRQLLSEAAAVSTRIRDGRFGPLRYRILASRKPLVFSLGGDLEFFASSIRAGQRARLHDYGVAAIDEIWANVTGCGMRDLTTVALVSGEAQGGGFEAALSCHVLIAERGAHFGFPEGLFGLFPGMGGAALLACRVGADVVGRLLRTPLRYSAEFLHEIGVVDYLAPPGAGANLLRDLMQRDLGETARQRRAAFSQLSYPGLLEGVNRWVASAMALSERNLRSIAYILAARQRAAV